MHVRWMIHVPFQDACVLTSSCQIRTADGWSVEGYAWLERTKRTLRERNARNFYELPTALQSFNSAVHVQHTTLQKACALACFFIKSGKNRYKNRYKTQDAGESGVSCITRTPDGWSMGRCIWNWLHPARFSIEPFSKAIWNWIKSLKPARGFIIFYQLPENEESGSSLKKPAEVPRYCDGNLLSRHIDSSQ